MQEGPGPAAHGSVGAPEGCQPSCTTSKSETFRLPNAGFRTSLSQRVSYVPWTYMSEPLSATMSPYVFIAWKIRRSASGYEEMSFDDFSRRRVPIGGAPDVDPARWEAGKT